MELIEAAEYLVRVGAILGLVLGLLSSLYWGFIVLLGFAPPYLAVNVYEILMLIVSILALGFCYTILSRFLQWLQADPMRAALYLIGLGIIVAIGAWGIAGLLIVIGAVLILIDETS
ncbi:hypothetical protein E2P64_06110 [Candidatus Bathyarchaeota archaeon]|nr:hypothetical protein E2P64_06110 [Candidatus Bathyarchaeota archaeon]